MEAVYPAVKKAWRYCALLLLVVVVLMPARTSGRPSYQTQFPSDNINYCKTNEEINELCQRCVKSTLSNVVFQMCCNNKEDAMDWCNSYINFGIQGS